MGAFLIAHRIKRPTLEELAGILDAFDQLACPVVIPATAPAPVVLSSPYDGQERLACVTPLTALVCSALGQGIVLHGTTGMPPKHGLTSFDILASLGVDLAGDRQQLSAQYQALGLAWVYLPVHFPEAYALQTLRDELGKRPPLATAELIWNPVRVGLPILGYTHRETINLAIGTAQVRGGPQELVMVRGVQGSVNCTMFHPNLGCHWQAGQSNEFRLMAADYGLGDDDLPFLDCSSYPELIQQTLKGAMTPLRRATIFNSAFVLFHAQFAPSLAAGIALATQALNQGLAYGQLEKLLK
jgi:anthranilate phosphoribosyltransferase